MMVNYYCKKCKSLLYLKEDRVFDINFVYKLMVVKSGKSYVCPNDCVLEEKQGDES